MTVGAIKSPKKPTQPKLKASRIIPLEGEGVEDQCLTQYALNDDSK